MTNLLSIIIRTMPTREHFLDRCLLNMSGQNYSEFELIIVGQHSNLNEDYSTLKEILQLWKPFFKNVIFISHYSITDARNHSLNLGLERATGRYIAFLDDDDKIYPNHYLRLIDSLQKSDYAWAYCDIIRADYNKYGQLISRSLPFRQSKYSFLNHLKDNFIPIHSFVLDREKINNFIKFDPDITMYEDYYYLLQIAKEHPPLYLSVIGGEYCVRYDGSNTIPVGSEKLDAEIFYNKQKKWLEARRLLDTKKEKLIGWWTKELDEFSIVPTGYYKESLKEYYNSTSWKMTKWLRIIYRFLKNQPCKEVLIIPDSDSSAQLEIFKILRSTSWEITAIFRIITKITARIINRFIKDK